jgi:3alpha(or 20beta)-hydroxysteroid dehydrogenase
LDLEGALADKVAIITGGARGQGAAEAARFVAEGARVVLTDVLVEEGSAVAESLGDAGTFLEHDVTDPGRWSEVVEETVDQHGRLDVLVNNAGVFTVRPMVETSPEEYERVVRINQFGTFLGMQAAIGPMVASGGGSIVNISSVAGLRGAPGTIAYAASKWAVRGMTKVAARELAALGVRVNSVHPGLIETAMMDEVRQFGAEVVEAALGQVPAGRFGTVDDVTELVLWLACDASRYCTGSEFVVDGGLTT